MKTLIKSFIVVILASTLLWGATQTINTLPAQNSTFLSTLNSFLSAESASRFQLQFSGFVYSGGLGAISANLTHTISAVTGLPYGYYVYKAATSHTYTNTTRTFVYLDYDDSRTITIAGASITRSTYLVFAEMTAGSTRPATPTGCVPLMQVDATGGALTAISDLRAANGVKTFVVTDSLWGTTGNGITDDTAALQSAITAAGAIGGTVFLPSGTYKISTALSVPSGVTLQGSGWCTRIVPSGDTGTIYIATSAVRVQIRDLYIDATSHTSAASSSSEIGTGTGCTSISVNNVYIHNVYKYGIALLGTRCSATGNTIYDGRGNENLIHLVGSYTQAIGNTLYNNSGGANHGITLAIGSYGTVQGNTLYKCDITSEEYTDFIIIGNTINSDATHMGVSCFHLTSDTAYGRGVISNNTITNAGYFSGLYGGGIAVKSGYSDMVISDNVIKSSGGFGISIGNQAVSRYTVRGNIINGVSTTGTTDTYGIYVDYVDQAVIADNEIDNLTTGSGNLYGIRVSTSATNVTVKGGHIKGATYGIRDGNGGITRIDGVNFISCTTKVLFGTSPGLFNDSSSAFASLLSPGDGSSVYCSDCTQTSPCAGSGSGALARRINGAWICGVTGQGGTKTLSGGTGTVTVPSGCRAICTDTTANASVKCAVSGTTLTITGTTTDNINWFCF